MKRQDLYQLRLDELEWNRSTLVKAIVEIRKNRGEDCSFEQIQTSIYKALQQPEKASARLNDEIVEALGGKIIVQWSQRIEIS
jgi:hypothetical protein